MRPLACRSYAIEREELSEIVLIKKLTAFSRFPRYTLRIFGSPTGRETETDNPTVKSDVINALTP